MTIKANTFKAIEKGCRRDAVEHAKAIGGTAISYAGKTLVAGRALVAALEVAAAKGLVEFAYLMADPKHPGRVVTIPVGR